MTQGISAAGAITPAASGPDNDVVWQPGVVFDPRYNGVIIYCGW